MTHRCLCLQLECLGRAIAWVSRGPSAKDAVRRLVAWGQGVTAGSLSLPSCSAEACGTSDTVHATTHPAPRPGTARGFSTWPQAAPRPRGAEPCLQAATFPDGQAQGND